MKEVCLHLCEGGVVGVREACPGRGRRGHGEGGVSRVRGRFLDEGGVACVREAWPV